jgi:hypothetical protein
MSAVSWTVKIVLIVVFAACHLLATFLSVMAAMPAMVTHTPADPSIVLIYRVLSFPLLWIFTGVVNDWFITILNSLLWAFVFVLLISLLITRISKT